VDCRNSPFSDMGCWRSSRSSNNLACLSPLTFCRTSSRPSRGGRSGREMRNPPPPKKVGDHEREISPFTVVVNLEPSETAGATPSYPSVGRWMASITPRRQHPFPQSLPRSHQAAASCRSRGAAAAIKQLEFDRSATRESSEHSRDQPDPSRVPLTSPPSRFLVRRGTRAGKERHR